MRWELINVAEMREFLGACGLPTNGSRGELIARLNGSTVADHCGQAAQATRRASTVEAKAKARLESRKGSETGVGRS